MEQGVLTFLKETDYTIGGRKVEFISADTGGAPAGAKTKVQELVERDKVDVILGPLAAFELCAITDYIQRPENAAAESGRRRRPDAAQAQSLLLARLGDLVAGHAADGPLRGDRTEAQARRHASPRISPSVTRRSAAFRLRSRRTAAASSTSSGRLWSRPTTRPMSRRSPIATACARALPDQIRCAS